MKTNVTLTEVREVEIPNSTVIAHTLSLVYDKITSLISGGQPEFVYDVVSVDTRAKKIVVVMTDCDHRRQDWWSKTINDTPEEVVRLAVTAIELRTLVQEHRK